MIPVQAAFGCPPDCGRCCSQLTRAPDDDELAAWPAFRRMLALEGVYACGDAMRQGISLSPPEARDLMAQARERGIRARIHPRTFLLETRRRLAVVLDWHLSHARCAFLDGFSCSIYDARPLVCRAYPVMRAAPAWTLAPSCPLTPEVEEARARRDIQFGTHFRIESRARRAIDARHTSVDETAFTLLAMPGARFARDLGPREAARRLRAYRVVDEVEYRERIAPMEGKARRARATF